MTTRKYTSRSQQTTLTSAVTSGATILPVVSASTLLGGATISAGQTFTVVIDPDTALEEIVDVTAVSANNLTVTRDIDMSGALAQDHGAGAVVRHMIIGRDLRESNLHIEATGAYNDGTGAHTLHGLTVSDGAVVGTTATQTLTNKTLVSPILTGTLENDSGITFEGSTVDANQTTLSVVDPTADRTILLPDASGTIVLQNTTDTLTNKTLTSPIINGSPVITGLSSSGMVNSSATPKVYVDSILGSATAASTSAASAATSASSAATSATSAATSASLALTSANSAATSATAAANSATSAAASATAAATSAASASTSQTAAATSAASAATSATSAAASVASIAGYATTASNSAAAAATSATSAAASATAAATSASSAATSASSAATTYTAYDQRYLGSKSSAPTLDNQGNALITGATYWNSSTTTMYVWSGSTWQAISNASVVTSVTASTGITVGGTSTAPTVAIDSTVVTLNGTQSLTNKTHKGNFVIQSGGGAGLTNNYLTTDNTTGKFTVHSGYPLDIAASGDIVLTTTSGGVKVDTDIIATLTASQTLTNKTLTTPVINGATVSGAVTSTATVSGETQNNLTLTGTLTANGSTGTSGYYLQTTGTGVQWAPAASDPTADIFMMMGA